MKLKPIDEYKVRILHDTGCITQGQLAKLFRVSQQRISEIVRKK
jgi:predicted XRE-type DNA-binding protein